MRRWFVGDISLPISIIEGNIDLVSPSVRTNISKTLQILARLIGSRIRDAKTGRVLGTAFMLSWRGKLHLLGYTGPPVRPVFLSQSELSYSRQSLGFTQHPEVDFERL